MNEYNVKATELWDSLMGIEMQLVDQLEVCNFFRVHLIILLNQPLTIHISLLFTLSNEYINN